MRPIQISLMLGMFFIATASPLPALENGPLLDAVKKITDDKIVRWAEDPVVVNAVKEANKSAARSTDEIAQLDQRWIGTEGVDEWIGKYLNNECARFLKSLQAQAGGQRQMFPEIFVMDRQGCIVAETNKTTDFYQGDENKFIKSFADGKGGIFIDETTFDESTRSYSVQVSVPVLDPETRQAIGAMTVSVDLDAVGEQMLQ